MTGPLIGLVAAIVLGAAVLLVHLATVWVTVRSEVAAPWKWLALVPPLTPVAAWRAGKRKASGAWIGLVVAYATVRILLG